MAPPAISAALECPSLQPFRMLNLVDIRIFWENLYLDFRKLTISKAGTINSFSFWLLVPFFYNDLLSVCLYEWTDPVSIRA